MHPLKNQPGTPYKKRSLRNFLLLLIFAVFVSASTLFGLFFSSAKVLSRCLLNTQNKTRSPFCKTNRLLLQTHRMSC